MANKIQFRRGLKSKAPTLSAGEPGWFSDTLELFIGTGSGNVNMGGSQWYTGTAMSGTGTTTGAYSYSACPIVKVGDIYLNTTHGYVYQCTTAGSGTAAKWTYKGCIKGASGEESKGDKGDDGVGIESVAKITGNTGSGASNTIRITLTDGTKYDFTVYNGEQGGTGDDGQRGSQWFSGTAMSGTSTTTGAYMWSDSTYKYVGDYYLNTTYGYVYRCTTAGSSTTAKWTYQGSIRGANGSSVTGQRGSSITTGTALEGTSTTTGAYSYSGASNAIVGDVYINTTYGYMYQCTTAGSGTTAKWTYRGKVIGDSVTISDLKVRNSINIGANDLSGDRSGAIGGMDNNITGDYAVMLGGCDNNVLSYQVKMGWFSKDGTAGTLGSTTGDALTIGNGTVYTEGNAFRVTYAGAVYGKAAYNSTGADYSEMFEWEDGNPNGEDRRGLFAYVIGDKIRLATAADTDRRRMGIISAYPAVVGDNFDDDWCGKWLTDIYGAPLTQTIHHDAVYEDREVTDPETGETTIESVLVHEACDAEEWVLNPDYDPDKEYIPREQRKEYAYWSFIGKLVVRDNGTCVEDGYCYPGNDGIATACADPDKGYYVMERLDENHVRVLVR